MKILVTGGAGYVGSTLVPILLGMGHIVRIFDNLMFGGNQILHLFRLSNFEFVKGDVRNATDVKNAAKDCDAIIHLAAIVGYPACRKEPQLAEDVNVKGTKNVIDAVTKNQMVFFASTGSNYGTVEDICTEETPLHPLSLYGQTKTIAEKMLMECTNAVIFRFATAFGVSPRLRLDLLINDFTYKGVTQGYLIVYEKHFMRTFIHVHDMARAFCFALENSDRMAKNIYNVGSDNMNCSKEDICNYIQKRVKCYVHYADVGEDIDKRNYVVSYKKINNLGYDTSISIDDGIAELCKAFQAIVFRTPYTNV